MDSMKDAINSVMVRQAMNEDIVIEMGKFYDSDFLPLEGVSYGDNVLGHQEDWHIIYGIDQKEIYLASEVKDSLGMDAINHTYIVNYETSEVELYSPIVLSGVKVRTYEEVRNLAE